MIFQWRFVLENWLIGRLIANIAQKPWFSVRTIHFGAPTLVFNIGRVGLLAIHDEYRL